MFFFYLPVCTTITAVLYTTVVVVAVAAKTRTLLPEVQTLVGDRDVREFAKLEDQP